MAFLGKLRLIKAYALRLEIGAGILPVLIEKQVEQLGAEIVVVGNVLQVAVDRQTGANLRADDARHFAGDDRQGRRLFHPVTAHQRQEIEYIAGLQDDAAVHVHFGQFQTRIAGDRLLGLGIGNADDDHLLGSVAKDMGFSGCQDQLERTLADNPGHHAMHCRRHAAPLLCPSRPLVLATKTSVADTDRGTSHPCGCGRRPGS
mgnify:CR=1 FL=1